VTIKAKEVKLSAGDVNNLHKMRVAGAHD
jgi:hypothetical protein